MTQVKFADRVAEAVVRKMRQRREFGAVVKEVIWRLSQEKHKDEDGPGEKGEDHG